MSFDARSLERLQELGRSLPKPLPKPESSSEPKGSSGKRHRVETETNPQALFGELMKASEDGTVPPHLMDRLRQSETDQERKRQAAQREQLQALQNRTNRNPTGLQAQGKPQELRPNQQRRRPATSEEQDLYVAFQQLLLEGDEEDQATP
ncbi:hypothetical protein MY494_01105 [Synechococcus sp. A10-1-5-1]|uniref:hypothetical protein n=1 Tax=Synechococcus sp. A10-1-5-1 TaxID=2936507 RepID=UPI00200145C2|nr:hypothetical protein [Synechococcus sp. A10-1-5-1]UPM50432.1 hypothetical protein MY494_01105 [Synechococcus sp. A10-1-5-1]